MQLGFALLIWIPLAFWMISVVGWMIMGDIDTLFGTVALGIGLGLGFTAMNPSVPELAPWCLIATITTVIVYVPIRERLRKRALAKIEFEQLYLAYTNLRAHSSDTLAGMKLAEMLQQRGFVAQAVGVARTILPDMPATVFPSEHRMYRNWESRLHPGEADQPIQCQRCKMMVPAGQLWCPRCGYDHLIHMVENKLFATALVKRMVSIWGLAAAAIVAIPLFAVPDMDGMFRAIGIVILMVVVAFLVVRGLVLVADS